MKRSHDAHGSIPMDMNSLRVMDLDLSLSPDAFGLQAFDRDPLPVNFAAGRYARNRRVS